MATKQGGVRTLSKTLRQFGLTTIRVFIILSILLAQSPAALAQAQVLPADRAAAPAAGVFDSCAAQT
ncbi:MAG: hypothetical protein AAGU05_07030, partial [Anaerolineaceae bacterium]